MYSNNSPNKQNSAQKKQNESMADECEDLKSNITTPPSKYDMKRMQLLQLTPVSNGIIVDRDTYIKQYQNKEANNQTAQPSSLKSQGVFGSVQSAQNFPNVNQTQTNIQQQGLTPYRSKRNLSIIDEFSKDSITLNLCNNFNNQSSLTNQQQQISNLSNMQSDYSNQMVSSNQIALEDPNEAQNVQNALNFSDDQEYFLVKDHDNFTSNNDSMNNCGQSKLDESKDEGKDSQQSSKRMKCCQNTMKNIDFTDMYLNQEEFIREFIKMIYEGIQPEEYTDKELEAVFQIMISEFIQLIFEHINLRDVNLLNQKGIIGQNGKSKSIQTEQLDSNTNEQNKDILIKTQVTAWQGSTFEMIQQMILSNDCILSFQDVSIKDIRVREDFKIIRACLSGLLFSTVKAPQQLNQNDIYQVNDGKQEFEGEIYLKPLIKQEQKLLIQKLNLKLKKGLQNYN
ncbi:UNKNOWN [Stylonychia lemnae]|uniref:Uncharacterized protein n=1 Tax=Stylonychia lemnae TaxID=5949 RepID=A0A077ZUE6_STYLE|nr:UNKNOWN [Stylonychia lemnae]|eukprot:CDW72096.1 UNKNOWN [Stylonychia lemnae]